MMKNSMLEMNNSSEVLKIVNITNRHYERLLTEYIAIGITQNKAQREIKTANKKLLLSEPWNNIKSSDICTLGFLGTAEEQGKILEEIIAEC